MENKKVVDIVTCLECKGKFTVEGMCIHPKSGKPWKLCPACRKYRVAEGKKRKQAQQPELGPGSVIKKDVVLSVDFTMYPDLLEGLKRCAVDAYRTPEQQIMLFIDRGLGGVSDE